MRDKSHRTIPDQYKAAVETARHIADMILQGWDIVITSGNGPQVGAILRRSELAEHEVHPVPLDYCGAQSQGQIGYMIAQALKNEFIRRGVDRTVTGVITRVEVDPSDPAFQNPTKPIGLFMTREEALRKREKFGWHVVEDAGRGWRRVVPSPRPKRILELEAIRELVSRGIIVYAVGGGGIPVIRRDDGMYEGTYAVIDKDFASSLLASDLDVDVLLISTAVEQVYLHYNTPNQMAIDSMTVSEARKYVKEGHFAAGSMLPKIEACVQFIEHGGDLAIITDPPNITRALNGETGTRLVPD